MHRTAHCQVGGCARGPRTISYATRLQQRDRVFMAIARREQLGRKGIAASLFDKNNLPPLLYTVRELFGPRARALSVKAILKVVVVVEALLELDD